MRSSRERPVRGSVNNVNQIHLLYNQNLEGFNLHGTRDQSSDELLSSSLTSRTGADAFEPRRSVVETNREWAE